MKILGKGHLKFSGGQLAKQQRKLFKVLAQRFRHRDNPKKTDENSGTENRDLVPFDLVSISDESKGTDIRLIQLNTLSSACPKTQPPP